MELYELDIKKQQEPIFVVGYEEGVYNHNKIFVFKTYEALQMHLSDCSPDNADDGIRAFCGIIKIANVLPTDIKREQVFLIITETTYDNNTGYITDTAGDSDLDILASDIENIVETEYVDIENIFVLYGYEMKIGLGVNPEEMDEASIESCIEISTEISKIQENI